MTPSDIGFGVIRKPTPPCPKGLYEYRCDYSGIDFVCHLEYHPVEIGSIDSYGAPYERDSDEYMSLCNVYLAGTDVDLYDVIAENIFKDIERFAMLEFRLIRP